jgi:hypothetical protein
MRVAPGKAAGVQTEDIDERCRDDSLGIYLRRGPARFDGDEPLPPIPSAVVGLGIFRACGQAARIANLDVAVR